MSSKQKLLDRIASRDLTVGIVGVGYVGLPLAVAFAEAGFDVVGVDVDPAKVDSLNAGCSYVEDIPDRILQPLVASGKFRATTDYAELAGVDAVSICVPTPLGKSKDPDISYIIDATERIAAYGWAGKLVVLESTTYPGTTEEVILPRLSENGCQVGQDFFLAFSPERIDPGRTDYTVWTTPKVIGGMTPACLEVAVALYGTVVAQPVPVSSPCRGGDGQAAGEHLPRRKSASSTKLPDVRPAGLNVWKWSRRRRLSPMASCLLPGPGLGGHCIPIDPHYLSWKLRTLNYTARFVELADDEPAYARLRRESGRRSAE